MNIVAALLTLGDMKSLKDQLENQREQEKTEREEVAESEYDDLRTRQSVAHTREDVAGLLMLVSMILGELRLIRWLLIAVAGILIYKVF